MSSELVVCPASRCRLPTRRPSDRSPSRRGAAGGPDGDYRFGGGGFAGLTVRVTREGDLLYAAVVPPVIPRVELRALGGLRFSTAPLRSGTTAEFERTGAARASAMLYHTAKGHVRHAQRVSAGP